MWVFVQALVCVGLCTGINVCIGILCVCLFVCLFVGIVCVCACACPCARVTILAASSRSSQARIFRGLAAIRALASSTLVPTNT